MKTMKKMLLVGAAVLALIAFAVPASASAAQWTVEGQPITEEQTMELEGTIGFQSHALGSSYECGMQAEATLVPGEGGRLDRFDIDSESCQGTGVLAGCEVAVSEAEPTSAISLSSVTFTVGFEVVFNFHEGCFIPTDIWNGTFSALVDNPYSISSMELGGRSVDVGGFGLEWGVSGYLYPSPAERYGIES